MRLTVAQSGLKFRPNVTGATKAKVSSIQGLDDGLLIPTGRGEEKRPTLHKYEKWSHEYTLGCGQSLGGDEKTVVLSREGSAWLGGGLTLASAR